MRPTRVSLLNSPFVLWQLRFRLAMGTLLATLPVLRSVEEVAPGDRVRIRVADGAVTATVGDSAAKRNGARTRKKASTR